MCDSCLDWLLKKHCNNCIKIIKIEFKKSSKRILPIYTLQTICLFDIPFHINLYAVTLLIKKI